MNWNEFLDKENITNTDWVIAAGYSSSWVTCGVGNLCEKIPREKKSGEPFDNELYRLGLDFHFFIKCKNIDSSKRILKMIENRSIELLKDL